MHNLSSSADTFLLIGNVMGGIVIGLFCGVIPLIVSILRKKLPLGIIGMIVCAVFGALMTVVLNQPAFLSIIPAAIFAGVIFLLTGKRKS